MSHPVLRRGGGGRARPPPRMFALVVVLVLSSVCLLFLRPPRPLVLPIVMKHRHQQHQQQQQKLLQEEQKNVEIDPHTSLLLDTSHVMTDAQVNDQFATKNETIVVEELQWTARDLYLPVSSEAKQGFERYEGRLQRRLVKKNTTLLTSLWRLDDLYELVTVEAATNDISHNATGAARRGIPSWKDIFSASASSTPSSSLALTIIQLEKIKNVTWRRDGKQHCLRVVPECAFFLELSFPVSFAKCCSEHQKLRATLQCVHDRIAAFNKKQQQHGHPTQQQQETRNGGVKLFWDSGSLLSVMRDRGTLVPWETDIDLGIVGDAPHVLDDVFSFSDDPTLSSQRRFWFESCDTKKSTGCRDAHYVYYAQSKAEAKLDTSRVEIWPFRVDGTMLRHPTRSWLDMPQDMVVVQQQQQKPNQELQEKEGEAMKSNCTMWGITLECPAQPVRYLDMEYADQEWRRPRTIHWGEKNVLPWSQQSNKKK